MQLIGLQLWTLVKWDVLKKIICVKPSWIKEVVCIIQTFVSSPPWWKQTSGWCIQRWCRCWCRPDWTCLRYRHLVLGQTRQIPHSILTIPKYLEKKTRIETDEIVNHLSIYESTCICTCQKGLWDTKEMYTSCYNRNVWYQLNNLLSQYDYFNVYYGPSLLKTLIAYNLNTCNKKHFYWEIASHCPGFLFISQWWERQNRGDPDYIHITKRNS